MPKTAVELFEDTRGIGDAIRQIENLGFPLNEVRVMNSTRENPVLAGLRPQADGACVFVW